MTHYIYPQNLRAAVSLWLWSMRDFIILCVAGLLSVVAMVQFGWLLPAALTLCFGFLTIRHDEVTVLDYIRWALRYFISTQQIYYWR